MEADLCLFTVLYYRGRRGDVSVFKMLGKFETLPRLSLTDQRFYVY